MKRRTYGGAESRRERARWAGLLPVPCCRCGRLIVPDPSLPGAGWQPDHWPTPREFGGTETWPAHAHCNASAGGKRGAEITNARRAATSPTMTTERTRNIRGI